MNILDEKIPEHVRLYAEKTKEILELKEAYRTALKSKEEHLKELEPLVLNYLKEHGDAISCPSDTQFGPEGNIRIRSIDRKRKISKDEQIGLMADFYKQHLTAEPQELEQFAKACLDYVDENRGRVQTETVYRHVVRPRKKRKLNEVVDLAAAAQT